MHEQLRDNRKPGQVSTLKSMVGDLGEPPEQPRIVINDGPYAAEEVPDHDGVIGRGRRRREDVRDESLVGRDGSKEKVHEARECSALGGIARPGPNLDERGGKQLSVGAFEGRIDDHTRHTWNGDVPPAIVEHFVASGPSELMRVS